MNCIQAVLEATVASIKTIIHINSTFNSHEKIHHQTTSCKWVHCGARTAGFENSSHSHCHW